MRLLVRLTNREFFSLSFISVVCANLLFLPSAFIDAGGRMGWMLALAAVAVDVVGSVVVVALAVRLRNHELTRVAVSEGGFAGRFAVAALSLFALGSLVMETKLNMLLFTGSLLQRTPEALASALPLVAALGLVYSGAVRMGRLAPWVLVLISLAVLLSVALTADHFQLGYLLPIYDPEGFRVRDMAFPASLGGIRAAWVTALLVVHTDEKVNPMRTMLISKVFGGALIVWSIVQPLALLGFGGANVTAQPFVYSITTMDVYSLPVERMEFLVRLILSIQVSFSMALNIFSGALGLRALFGRRPRYVVLAALYAVAGLAGSELVSTANQVRLFVYWIGTLNLLSIPLFGLLWLALRRIGPSRSSSPAAS